jgi:hypothetical protein
MSYDEDEYLMGTDTENEEELIDPLDLPEEPLENPEDEEEFDPDSRYH